MFSKEIFLLYLPPEKQWFTGLFCSWLTDSVMQMFHTDNKAN